MTFQIHRFYMHVIMVVIVSSNIYWTKAPITNASIFLVKHYLGYYFWGLNIASVYAHFQYSGQNALTLATYSGDRRTCDIILHTIRFDELNTIGLLSPLCVATLQGDIDLVKIYLAMESSSGNRFECSSASIHGICPLKLAQIMNNTDLTELLRSKHQTHFE